MRYPVSLNKIYAKERGELKKEIEDVVFNLGIGEVSAPLKIDGKCYVLKLENIMPSRQLTLAESQSAIHSYLYDIKMQEGMARWLDELKSKSYIKIY
jgi:parvulin-like peptidyl-prolyl isomerase